MAGGLIQLAVYGTQDIFLTGTPQITFFKVVYRRHTNFAIEPVAQQFDGAANFDNIISCTLEKVGDLMGKVYLEIQLPEICLKKHFSNNVINRQIAQDNFNSIQELYGLTYTYITLNTDIIRKLTILLQTNNISMTEIEAVMNDTKFIGPLIAARDKLQTYISSNPNFKNISELADSGFFLVQEIGRIDIQIVFNSIVCNVDNNNVDEPPEIIDLKKRKEILNVINTMLYQQNKKFYMKIYDVFSQKQQILNDIINCNYSENYKCAWVEEIGHSLIDIIGVQIGNQTIDRHTGDFMIAYNSLYLDEYQRVNYDKLIGNVPKLYTFDDKPKPSYTLLIPLQFWFCKFTGLSLPLVALRYHDVIINLAIKDLSKLFYYEDDPFLLDPINVQSLYNINLENVQLYVDYIYLDSDERRRFAQSSHEYLIEIVQFREDITLISQKEDVNLNFCNPTKYMFWFAQPTFYRENPTGRNKCQWNNFGTRPDRTGFPIESQLINLNGTTLTSMTIGDINHNYYNYVQPWWYFNNSPTDGLNIYSFAIMPMDHQPSGTCNMSRIDDLSIVMKFSNEFMTLIKRDVPCVSSGIYFAVYTYSYTILRIMSGMGALAFETTS